MEDIHYQSGCGLLSTVWLQPTVSFRFTVCLPFGSSVKGKTQAYVAKLRKLHVFATSVTPDFFVVAASGAERHH